MRRPSTRSPSIAIEFRGKSKECPSMVKDTTTYAIFEIVMRKLGFKKEARSDDIVRYIHPEPDTSTSFRVPDPRELVFWATFSGLRHLVDWRGIIEREDFNQLVRDTEAAH